MKSIKKKTSANFRLFVVNCGKILFYNLIFIYFFKYETIVRFDVYACLDCNCWKRITVQYVIKLECDQNGMWSKWNVLYLKCAQNGLWSKRNVTKMECDQEGMWSKWNMTKTECGQNGMYKKGICSNPI